MTAAIVILAATVAALTAAVVCLLLRRVRGEDLAAARGDFVGQRELAKRLVTELSETRQMLERANDIADDRRAEASELRADLERRAHAELVGERVVITTIDGHAIEGDLERLYSDGYLLSRAHYLQGDGPRELGGYITIREANESFIQRPDAPPAAAGDA